MSAPKSAADDQRGELKTIFRQYSSRRGISYGLLAFCIQPRTRVELAQFLGVRSTFYAMRRYIRPLIEEGKLAMTIPENPSSREQRFYTVE